MLIWILVHTYICLSNPKTIFQQAKCCRLFISEYTALLFCLPSSRNQLMAMEMDLIWVFQHDLSNPSDWNHLGQNSGLALLISLTCTVAICPSQSKKKREKKQTKQNRKHCHMYSGCQTRFKNASSSYFFVFLETTVHYSHMH